MYVCKLGENGIHAVCLHMHTIGENFMSNLLYTSTCVCVCVRVHAQTALVLGVTMIDHLCRRGTTLRIQ